VDGAGLAVRSSLDLSLALSSCGGLRFTSAVIDVNMVADVCVCTRCIAASGTRGSDDSEGSGKILVGGGNSLVFKSLNIGAVSRVDPLLFYHSSIATPCTRAECKDGPGCAA